MFHGSLKGFFSPLSEEVTIARHQVPKKSWAIDGHWVMVVKHFGLQPRRHDDYAAGTFFFRPTFTAPEKAVPPCDFAQETIESSWTNHRKPWKSRANHRKLQGLKILLSWWTLEHPGARPSGCEWVFGPWHLQETWGHSQELGSILQGLPLQSQTWFSPGMK